MDSIKIFMYYGKLDQETYKWCPTNAYATFKIDPKHPQLQKCVQDLRILFGISPNLPPLTMAHLSDIVQSYIYTNGPFSVSEDLVDVIWGLFKSDTTGGALTEHVTECRKLYQLAPKCDVFAQADAKYEEGKYIEALDLYIKALIHELPPLGLLFNLTTTIVSLSMLYKLKTKCTITQSKISKFEFGDFMTNITCNMVRKWLIGDGDFIFMAYLMRKMRPQVYEKHIQSNPNVDLIEQTRYMFKFLLKKYPLAGVPNLRFEGVLAPSQSADDWAKLVESIDSIRGLMASMCKQNQLQNVIQKIGGDPMISEYALFSVYLYKKPRLARLMAYYGHQLTLFAFKTKDLSSKIDHKEIQNSLKQLFKELLDLVKWIMDETLITQQSMDSDTNLKIIKTMVKLYQFVQPSFTRRDKFANSLKIEA